MSFPWAGIGAIYAASPVACIGPMIRGDGVILMLCPYCKVEYTADQPCFCHPSTPSRTLEAHPLRAADDCPTFPIAWNSHRGVRLD